MMQFQRLLPKNSTKVLFEDVVIFEFGWKNDPRHHLLHPQDVMEINMRFRTLKDAMKKESTEEDFEKSFFNIIFLVFKAKERMDFVSKLLLDLLDD
jgi:hypothetical protein